MPSEPHAVLYPEVFSTAAPAELLSAAARGAVGLDHRLLKAILDRFEDAVPEIVSFGLQERQDPFWIEDFLVDLFRYRPHPAAIPYLCKLLRTSYDEFDDELVEAFGLLGEAAVEPLLELSEDLEGEAKQEAAFILAALQARNPRVLNFLLDQLKADPEEGAFLLEVYGDPAALPALKEARAEQEARGADTTGLKRAIKRLSSSEAPAVWTPYDIWSDYPEQEAPKVGLLTLDERLRMTYCPNAEYRRAAVQSFGPESAGDQQVVGRLLEVARMDPDPAVRGEAWTGLGLVSDTEPIRQQMRNRLRDPAAPWEERAGVLVALSRLDEKEVQPFVQEFYERPETRAAALEAMRHTLNPEYAPYFSNHLEDPDVDCRREAVLGVGYLRQHSEAARLEKLFFDEDVRQEALYAYALAAPGKVTAAHARQTLKKIERLADGLSSEEGETVCAALDLLLEMHGRAPIFRPAAEDGDEVKEPESEPAGKPGRNDPCPCGSGKKYKKCCGA